MTNIPISQQQSLFLQSLSMVDLLIRLNNHNFLDSEYYKSLYKESEIAFKSILDNSRIGNPATLQLSLYLLLVIPKEILQGNQQQNFENFVNTEMQKIAPTVTTSYKGENSNNLQSINFCRHIRNAVSHGRCYYEQINNIYCVNFKDACTHNGQKCTIQISTEAMGTLINNIQDHLINYLKSSINNSNNTP